MNVLLLSYHFPPMGGAGVQQCQGEFWTLPPTT